MENKEGKIHGLSQGGYNPVYIWNAKPNEEDLDHAHLFDVHLEILEGEIEIRMDGESKILKAGDKIDIPRDKTHYGKAGIQGCEYIVAEKHS